MEKRAVPSLAEYFADVADPRVEGRCEHLLLEVISMALWAILTGAESWVEIETFGKLKEKWLGGFLTLPGGIPSHDTFGRIFAALEAEAFQKGFARFVEGVVRVSDKQGVAVAGKTARGSPNPTLGKSAIHRVSAWASESGIVLGQRKVDDKSNEIQPYPNYGAYWTFQAAS